MFRIFKKLWPNKDEKQEIELKDSKMAPVHMEIKPPN